MPLPDKSLLALFSEALEHEDPAKRARFLDEACGPDSLLRQQLENLLRAHDEAGGFLSHPSQAPAQSNGAKLIPDEKPGDCIGRYKLLEQIGEGGCGVVYLAEQEEPIRRRVALKVIKLGMDTKQVVARFEAERQALALMDHPNIARVLDAGATQSGRPFFVMELVRGRKVTEFCDQKKLPPRGRLELFVQVCSAIQHAHQKGIIHRDLKPSNILVTTVDGQPVPKVIDFGIAKATTNQRLTDQTLFTAFEQFIGTPAYMSPEQAEMSGVDVDTRTDVYSLGVVLYELLTGRTPFDTQALLRSGLDTVRRTIRETEPVPPSTRLRTLSDADQTTVAGARETELPKLIHLVKGDLDWVVMKCLEKERDRRYETASALARDIQRHLRNELVIARPPSTVYRVQKLVRRNKLAFAAAGAVAAALVLGMVLSLWQAVRATRAERQQESLRKLAEQAAAREAEHWQRAEQAGKREAQMRSQAEAQAYASDMNLAQQALLANNLGRAHELLDRHRPVPGDKDLRGWEWRYIWKQCKSDASFVLCQQPSSIYSLSASSDGKWLAAGESHGGLSIWDLQAREQVARLPAGDGEVITAFSPRQAMLGFSLESGSGTNELYQVRLWDVTAKQLIGDVISLRTRCQGLAFSADGATLITLTESGPSDLAEIALWQLPQGKKTAAYPVKQVMDMIVPFPFAVSADARFAAYRVPFGRIGVMDLTLGKVLWTSQSISQPTALAFSPDGSLLASGGGFITPGLHFWDVATGKEVRRQEEHRGFISSVVFWPNGKTVASAGADQTIHLWQFTDFATLAGLRALRGHKQEVWRLLLLPDEKTLISGSKDGSVCIWDTARVPDAYTHFTVGGLLLSWRFAADGKSILTLDRGGNCVRRDGVDFKESHPLVNIGAKSDGCLGDDGGWLAAGNVDGSVRIWDLSTGTQTAQFSAGQGKVIPRKLFSQGKRVVVYCDRDRSDHEWDVIGQREIQAWKDPADARAFAFSDDGHWWVGLDWAGVSSVRDLAAQCNLNPAPELREALGAAFSPQGELLAAASSQGFAKVWNIGAVGSAGPVKEAWTLRGFLQGAHSVAFSPDARRLAVGGDGREAIKIWDLQTGQEVVTLDANDSLFGHYGGTAFSPDGNLLGSLPLTGMLHLWRAPSWSEIEAAEQTQAKAPKE